MPDKEVQSSTELMQTGVWQHAFKLNNTIFIIQGCISTAVNAVINKEYINCEQFIYLQLKK